MDLRGGNDIWLNFKDERSGFDKSKSLLLFFRYTDLYSQEAVAFMNRLWETYERKGIKMLGVHLPEFSFEEDYQNVKNAINVMGIKWPVYLDNRAKVSSSFGVRTIPDFQLYDKSGQLLKEHIRAGYFGEIQEGINEILNLNEKIIESHEHTKDCIRPTKPVYLGYKRGGMTLSGDFINRSADFGLPEVIAEGSVGLNGKFIVTENYAESKQKGAEVIVGFKAKVSACVATSSKGESRLKLYVNGKNPDSDGEGVPGDGVVKIEAPGLYYLVSGKKQDGHMKLELIDGGVRFFKFMFSGCVRENIEDKIIKGGEDN
jgi:hypothetical protein